MVASPVRLIGDGIMMVYKKIAMVLAFIYY